MTLVGSFTAFPPSRRVVRPQEGASLAAILQEIAQRMERDRKQEREALARIAMAAFAKSWRRGEELALKCGRDGHY